MKTLKLLGTLVALFTLSFHIQAQHPSSILDLESTTQGVLAPRMTSVDRAAIAAPAEGLLVFDTDTKTFWVFQGMDWQKMSGSELTDADNDTKVEVERTADDDVIRLRAAGTDRIDVGATTTLIREGLELGGTSGVGPNQLNIAGAVNSGVNQGSPTGTYKLRISGYNNDDSDVVYPIYSVDENFNVDFSIKNRDLVNGTPTIGYFGGNVGIGQATPQTKLHIQGGTDLNLGASSGYMALGSTSGLNMGLDNNEIQVRNNGSSATLYLQAEGSPVNIGLATATGFKLNVDGKIACEELLIDLSGDWPDYVFESSYDLKTLSEVQTYINEKGHLPGVPSAQDIEENGIIVGEMNKILMEKIEELTLYILQQEKRIKALENKN